VCARRADLLTIRTAFFVRSAVTY